MKQAMKARHFYPLQVLRRLNGKDTKTLSRGQRTALTFFMRNARRFGASICINNEAPATALLSAGSADAAEAVKLQYPSKIRIQIGQQQMFLSRPPILVLMSVSTRVSPPCSPPPMGRSSILPAPSRMQEST